MKTILIVCSILAAITSQSQTLKLNEKFIAALHQVESSGRFGAIRGDYNKKTGNWEALGPFQLHFSYWRDATEFDKKIGGKYSDCADYNYSKRIVAAYLSRYARRYIESNDFKMLARIENGGPTGDKKSSTIPYAQKVEKEMVKLSK